MIRMASLVRAVAQQVTPDGVQLAYAEVIGVGPQLFQSLIILNCRVHSAVLISRYDCLSNAALAGNRLRLLANARGGRLASEFARRLPHQIVSRRFQNSL